ncbi:hypothetical protein PR048_001772 [Dryococelus australis]|uniref:RNA-directed DNA polymerase n=1 Tax=Dryococelus australis TaxID=614101 RepID=A0ABQ9IIB3_9NEOP|nr:hypothetical protein PR048_001772 [Dryococelus australis]
MMNNMEEWETVLPPSLPVFSTQMSSVEFANISVLPTIPTLPNLQDCVNMEQLKCPIANKWCSACTKTPVEQWCINSDAWSTFVPASMHDLVLRSVHAYHIAGNPGSAQTHRNVLRYFYLPGISRQVRSFVCNCITCKHLMSQKTDGIQQQTTHLSSGPFNAGALDLMGPCPWTSTAYPILSARTRTIGKVMESKFFSHWDYPHTVFTDNGTQFTGCVWCKFCSKWIFHHHTTAVYLPRANPMERRNQIFLKI